MGFFDNLITIRVGEIFEVEKGIEVLKKQIKRHNAFEMINIPMFIFQMFEKLMYGKKITFYHTDMPKMVNESDNHFLKKTSRNQIRAAYSGNAALLGSISFGSKLCFNITHSDKEIYDISTIKLVKCLRCLGRSNLHSSYNKAGINIHFGEVHDISKGLDVFKEKLSNASKVIVNNLPDFLLEEILQIISQNDFKTVKILTSPQTSLKKKLKNFSNARLSLTFIKTNILYHGIETNPGGVAMDDVHFAFSWVDDNIFDIRTTEWSQCVECLFNIHNAEWLIGKRIRI